MQQFNQYMGMPVHLIWESLVNWIKEKDEPKIENLSKPLDMYNVSLNASIDHQKEYSKKPSTILKRCEGARGILYINETRGKTSLPHSILKKTKIIEVKDVSIKIRVYEDAVVNQLIHIENILGFLKEVD